MAVIFMLVYNGKEYSDYELEITYGKYRIHRNGKIVEEVSPFFSFRTDDFIIGIETIYDEKDIKGINTCQVVDISSYISDFCFEDAKGWISLNHGDIFASLEKLKDDTFMIKASCKAEDLDFFDIRIEDKISLLGRGEVS